MNTEDVLTYWAAWMRAEDLGARTIRDRLNFIRMLEREAGPIGQLTKRDLIVWLGNHEWSSSTRVHYRSALHTFYTWLQAEELRSDNPAARLPKVKSTRREPTPIPVAEIQRLLESGIYTKTRVMVALHYYLGLRVSEIAAVHGRDISWTSREITVLGKGRKLRVLPVPEAAWTIFQSMPQTGYWFPNHETNVLYPAGEGHILGNSVSGRINGALKRAGLPYRAHDLRAATATEMNRAGTSAFIIQKAMRHENMETTTRYMGVRSEEILGGLESLPVLQMPERSGRQRPSHRKAA